MCQFFDQLREVKQAVEQQRAMEQEQKKKEEAQERMQRLLRDQREKQVQAHSQEPDLFGQYATIRTTQMTRKLDPVAPEEVPVLGTLKRRVSVVERKDEKGGILPSPRKRFSGKAAAFFDFLPDSPTRPFSKAGRRQVLQAVHSKKSRQLDFSDSSVSSEPHSPSSTEFLDVQSRSVKQV